MTTHRIERLVQLNRVVEAYRLDRYDNFIIHGVRDAVCGVVEAYRLDRYDNYSPFVDSSQPFCCRSLSFG